MCNPATIYHVQKRVFTRHTLLHAKSKGTRPGGPVISALVATELLETNCRCADCSAVGHNLRG